MLFRYRSGREVDINWHSPPPPVATIKEPLIGDYIMEEDGGFTLHTVMRHFKLVDDHYEEENLVSLVPT
jgi:hypothetical protein